MIAPMSKVKGEGDCKNGHLEGREARVKAAVRIRKLKGEDKGM